MKLRTTLFLAAALAGAVAMLAPTRIAAAESPDRITILYDAFGADAAMKKDWGFSALVEISGKRILFDTGNDPTSSQPTSRRRTSTSPASISWCCHIATPITWLA